MDFSSSSSFFYIDCFHSPPFFLENILFQSIPVDLFPPKALSRETGAESEIEIEIDSNALEAKDEDEEDEEKVVWDHVGFFF